MPQSSAQPPHTPILFLFFLLLIVASALTPARADGVVADFVSDTEIEILWRTTPSEGPNELLVIRSAESAQIIGYARQTAPTRARVEVHADAPLVRPGQLVERVDLTHSHPHLDGRFDLIQEDNKQINTQYQPIPYMGAQLGQTAATLAPQQWLAGPGLLGYGVKKRLHLTTQPFRNLLGEPNLGAKYRILSAGDYRFSLGTSVTYSLPKSRGYGDLDLYVDSFSNSVFSSATRLSFLTKRPDGTFLTPETQERTFSTQLQVINAWILPNWDRVFFGPKYNFNASTLGGVATYHAIFSPLEVVLGVNTEDVLEARFSDSGYTLTVDFWWRL